MTRTRIYGGGGPNSARVWWPAGMEAMTPQERSDAFQRGWWRDGDYIVKRNGKRLLSPWPIRPRPS